MPDFPSRLSAALADRYRLERELGQGGMATVYLAHDVRHDRRVALKVLRPELAAVIGAERFLAEIRTTANLQHPHVLPLFDSGTADGYLYYVMPFVEGETLRDRLSREKQLPIPEAVRIAGEVAAALDYAHRHGVIHRDIKPENILLHDGSALVADFGIALAASRAGGTRMTETGMSLGTPAYMSPEQAMGERDITARSDVYALGCVLYEMLAGEPPFSGPTAQAIVARVMTEPPRGLALQRRTVPPQVEAAVNIALEKLPADRFASAAEFAAALEGRGLVRHPAAALSDRPIARSLNRLLIATTLLLVVAVGWLAFDRLTLRAPVLPPPVYRFNIELPRSADWVGDIFSIPALSPDGTRLVYNGQDSAGHRWLYLRAMDQLDPVAIPGSENATGPFFSPDGRRIAFTQGTHFVQTAVTGGVPETICEVGGLAQGTWLESNVVVFTDGTHLGECTLSGQVTTLVTSDSGEAFNFPHGLPGDRGVLFNLQRGSTSRLVVFDLRARSLKRLDIAGSNPRYVETGHLVYVSPEGVVRAVRFAPNELAIAGDPVTVDEGVRIDNGAAIMALSRSGMIVTADISASRQSLELLDRAGRSESLYSRVGGIADPRISRDGRHIVVTLRDRDAGRKLRSPDIWLLDRSQATLSRLSFDTSAFRPAWSSDGRQVAFVREIGSRTELRLVAADGSAQAGLLPFQSGLEPWEVLFTPDGRSMVVRTVGGSGRRDIWLVGVDSSVKPVPLLESPADEVSPAVSPDSRWMAYVSNESGRAEVYVRSFPGMGSRFQVSLSGGTEPAWSPLGGELFFRSGTTLTAAEVRAGSGFEVHGRTPLFSVSDYAADLTHAAYDVAPDGRHFVMVRNLDVSSSLTVILNRFQNLGAAGSGGAPSTPAQ